MFFLFGVEIYGVISRIRLLVNQAGETPALPGAAYGYSIIDSHFSLHPAAPRTNASTGEVKELNTYPVETAHAAADTFGYGRGMCLTQFRDTT